MTWRQVLTTIGEGLTTHLKEGRWLADVRPGFEFNLILLVVLGHNNYWEVLFLATFIRNFSTN